MNDVYYFVHSENPTWHRGNIDVEGFSNYEDAVERAKELAEEHGNEENVFISKGEKIATVELKSVIVHKNEAEVIPVKKRR